MDELVWSLASIKTLLDISSSIIDNEQVREPTLIYDNFKVVKCMITHINTGGRTDAHIFLLGQILMQLYTHRIIMRTSQNLYLTSVLDITLTHRTIIIINQGWPWLAKNKWEQNYLSLLVAMVTNINSIEKTIQKPIRKKSLKPYFLSDLDKIGTKMFCKSYIL